MWENSPVSIQFHFDTYRQFERIRIYSANNKYHSIQIRLENYPIIIHYPSSIAIASTVFMDTIVLSEYGPEFIGKQIEMIFEFDDEFLFLTEMTFESQPSIRSDMMNFSSNTTRCPQGKAGKS